MISFADVLLAAEDEIKITQLAPAAQVAFIVMVGLVILLFIYLILK